MRIQVVALAGMGCALLMGACGATEDAQGRSSTSTSTDTMTSSSTGPAGGTATSTPTPASPTSTSTSITKTETTAPPPVQDAFPGAGGPRPADALPMTSLVDPGYGSGQVAIVRTQTGAVKCELALQHAGCGAEEMIPGAPFGEGPTGANWYVALGGSGVPKIGPKSDAPYWGYDPPGPQVLEYGRSYYHEKYVCGSSEKGMTCWDTSTGHGVFMNRTTYRAF